jgi:hypothetical protein
MASGRPELWTCLGAGRLQNSIPAYPQGQERHPSHAPPEWPRNARVAAPSAGDYAINLRIRLGTRRTAIGARFLPHDRAGMGVTVRPDQSICLRSAPYTTSRWLLPTQRRAVDRKYPTINNLL